MSNALAKRGHSVEIVTLKFHSAWKKKAENSGIALKEASHAPNRAIYFAGIGFLSKKLSHLIDKNPEVLCPHNFPATLAAMGYKKGSRTCTPTVWYCEEPFRFYYDQQYLQTVPFHFYSAFLLSKWLYSRSDRSAVRRFTDSVLANSKFTMRRVKEVYGISGKVLYLGTDPDRFKPDIRVPEKLKAIKDGTDCFLFAPVGRLNLPKNVIRLLLVAKELASNGYKFRMVVTGKGYLETRLLKMINNLGMANCVFLTTVSEDELRYYYALADVVLYPSIDEPFGLSVIEAMASGVPPVVANVGGPSETVIDGVTGVHVNPYEVASIFKGVATLLDDKGLRDRMGQLGRKHVLSSFTWERVVEEYEQHLEKVVRRGDETDPA